MPKKAFKAEAEASFGSVEEFLKAVKECGRAEYSDGELLKALLNEARRDCFQGVGRVFLSEFSRWYNCKPERVVSLLKASGLRWRFGPTDDIVLISL